MLTVIQNMIKIIREGQESQDSTLWEYRYEIGELIKYINKLEKHDCERLRDEMKGCSICGHVWNNTTKEDLAFASEHTNARILELQRKLEA